MSRSRLMLTFGGILKSQQIYLFQRKSHMNSSCILVRQIFFYFNFWTQWRWAGQDLSDALYGVHQTRDSLSVHYDGSGFHSGGVSRTGVFKHRSVNVIRFAGSSRNETAFCPDAISLGHVFRKLVNVDPRLIKEWTMSSVRLSNSGCTRIVGRARM